jgi:hypothetical protein
MVTASCADWLSSSGCIHGRGQYGARLCGFVRPALARRFSTRRYCRAATRSDRMLLFLLHLQKSFHEGAIIGKRLWGVHGGAGSEWLFSPPSSCCLPGHQQDTQRPVAYPVAHLKANLLVTSRSTTYNSVCGQNLETPPDVAVFAHGVERVTIRTACYQPASS